MMSVDLAIKLQLISTQTIIFDVVAHMVAFIHVFA